MSFVWKRTLVGEQETFTACHEPEQQSKYRRLGSRALKHAMVMLYCPMALNYYQTAAIDALSSAPVCVHECASQEMNFFDRLLLRWGFRRGANQRAPLRGVLVGGGESR